MSTADEAVLALALARGLARPDQVEAARARAQPGAVRAQLVTDGAIDGAVAAQLLAEALDLPFVTIGDSVPSAAMLAAVPRSFARQHRVCPLADVGGARRVALADPLDLDVLDSLAHLLGGPVAPCVAAPDDLERALTRLYGLGDQVMENLIGPLAEAGAEVTPAFAGEGGETGAPAVTVGDAPVIRLVESLVREAVRLRASDIHLEPLERRFRVRYRVDGVLLEGAEPPKALQLPVVSRLKIMANISIAEKRLPQDGRIRLAVAGRSLDLRVSSLPTVHGESIVMRLLDQQAVQPDLAELGFLREDESAFRRLIAAPDGILLVTGPTGSGKTTTLYGCLHALNQTDRKIITVEDPVEYQLSGVNQVPVRPEIGMTFAAALRAMLRQSPNIVMVGEIRDRETADIALNAALTGHLVLSTLHTNDAPGAVTRLCDLGAKPFLVAAGLRATLAQRLVRRVCPHCAREHSPSAAELRGAGLTAAQAAAGTLRRGAGCAACHGTGYLGRVGIFELFHVDDAIRALVHERAGALRLRRHARAAGMRTLREDGLRKVLAGLTTIEEVVAVTAGDAD